MEKIPHHLGLWVWAVLWNIVVVVAWSTQYADYLHMTSYAFTLHGVGLLVSIAYYQWKHTYAALAWCALPMLELSLTVLATVNVILWRDTAIQQKYLSGHESDWYNYTGMFVTGNLLVHELPVVSSLLLSAFFWREIRSYFIPCRWPKHLWLLLQIFAYLLPLGLYAAFSNLAAEYGYVNSLLDIMVIAIACGACSVFWFVMNNILVP